MTSRERFQEIQELFQLAVNLPPPDREAFLREKCFADESLRHEIELLLAEDARPSGFVQTGYGGSPVLRSVLAIGSRLGPYEFAEIIGSGGMGEVYRARDTKLHRDVALKVLPPNFAGDPERVSRFRWEAQLLGSLNHPHIAAIYGLEDSNGMLALVMELAEGPTLAERISTGPIALGEVLPIATQICDALETAHERGKAARPDVDSNWRMTGNGEPALPEFDCRIGILSCDTVKERRNLSLRLWSIFTVSVRGSSLATPLLM